MSDRGDGHGDNGSTASLRSSRKALRVAVSEALASRPGSSPLILVSHRLAALPILALAFSIA
jgi:hypothetical protein